MTLNTLLATLVLALAPLAVAAECMGSAAKAEQQAMSCTEGTQWDATTATCIPVTTS